MSQPRSYRTKAIIVSRRRFSEADRIVTFFSPELGLHEAIAHGIRKPTSRKSGSLELFNLVSLYIIKGKSIDIISEASIIDSFSRVKKDFALTHPVFYMLEIVGRLFSHGQSQGEIFDLLQTTINLLNTKKLSAKQIDCLLSRFEIKVLEESGFFSLHKSNFSNQSIYECAMTLSKQSLPVLLTSNFVPLKSLKESLKLSLEEIIGRSFVTLSYRPVLA
ncbi:DNA repair protein RecO [Candidatus Curtissbacteria bacterium]|nr:DNA repair protein RecO [Candidatus Curtissbacteria bacterium]